MTPGQQTQRFLTEHVHASRRYFLQLGTTCIAAVQALPLFADDASRDPVLQAAVDRLESWLTPAADFKDVSRGKPKPHSLSEDRRAEVGLTRESWRLEVNSDPEYPAKVGNPLSKSNGTALDFATLLEIAKSKTVRFAKVMTCLNIGCPLGMGIWEGVPLRDVVWLTRPQENLRRVFYYGYHNEDEKQMFRSSLPVGRVLEDTRNLPPVILCFKLNGQWLSPERGGPVRIVVPEAYGFKSVKWLTHVMLSNISHANDTYAEQNNDVDSDLKTFCATLSFPNNISADQPIPITGWAQAGISGLKQVQVWIQNKAESWSPDDPHFTQAPWQDAAILPLSNDWNRDLADDDSLSHTLGFTVAGHPQHWPLRLCKAHWAHLHAGLPRGEYVLRCRTIDEQGGEQPMPRPFRKSGHAAIEERSFKIL